METLLNQVVKEHTRLLAQGKEPDSLYLNEPDRRTLAKQIGAAYSISEEAAYVEFLGMSLYSSEHYRSNQFRIYCKVRDLGEF